MDEIEALDADLGALEVALDGAGAMTRAFQQGLEQTDRAAGAAVRSVDGLSRGMSRGLKRAFDGLIFDGAALSDALGQVAGSMADAAYAAALRPVTNQFAGAITNGVESLFSGAFAQGAAFTRGRVTPFATGGIVSGPVAFPMRGGTGLMGEAGPEAIMPLSRGSDGRLGVRMDGSAGRPVQVTVNINTPDAKSFERSKSQIAAQMSRAIGRADRNR